MTSINKLREKYVKTVSEETRTKIRKSKLGKVFRVVKIVNEPSSFPEMERKSKFNRYKDHIKWLAKYKKVCYPYNEFGLDIKNFRNMDDYMDIVDMRKQKQQETVVAKDKDLDMHKEKNLQIKYTLLADDKFVFYSYINTIKEGLTPNILLIFRKDKIVWQNKTEYKTVDDFIKNLKEGKYICKSIIGLGGHSVYLLTVRRGKVLVNNGSLTLKELYDITESENYMIQEYVYQHDDIAKLNPTTLNTIRIISTRFSEEVNILAAMIRIGVGKDSVVDNASSGGTFVGIDVETGKLREYGYYHKGKRQEKHPTTKVVYKDLQLPYWKEVIELIKTVHPFLYGLNSIGWDIAITNEGPKIIEINWDWGTKGLQIANGGLKHRWEELKTK